MRIATGPRTGLCGATTTIPPNRVSALALKWLPRGIAICCCQLFGFCLRHCECECFLGNMA